MAKKEVIYWSPCLNKVGTVTSTINSAISLSKYSKKFNPIIINAAGEWDEYTYFLKSNNVKIIKLYKFSYIKLLPKNGFLGSRFSYLVIILLSVFPLIKILRNKNIAFLICHLLTSLPLLINYFFKLDLKLILRISGLPNLNILRKYFWKIAEKKIYRITTPTIDLKKNLILNGFDKDKIFLLYDAILFVKQFINTRKIEEKDLSIIGKKFILGVGRLTKQKNFYYLINEYSQSPIKENYNLVILGKGEDRKKLKNLIFEKNLQNKIFLLGSRKNIYSFMKKASIFVLSSLWEDPGFVMIESAFSNLFIIASDCPNGPKEFLTNNLDDNRGGFIFKSNNNGALANCFNKFSEISEKEKFTIKVFAKKKSKNYTIFNHYKLLNLILS